MSTYVHIKIRPLPLSIRANVLVHTKRQKSKTLLAERSKGQNFTIRPFGIRLIDIIPTKKCKLQECKGLTG